MLLRIAYQMWSLILSYDFRKILESCPQVLASFCDRPIFLGILVRVTFLANVCIVSYQTFEARNLNHCYELHARSGLRFTIHIIRLHEEA